MNRNAVNLAEKFKRIAEPWSPRVIAELNDYQIKLARLEGEFVWHDHADTDEMFLCLEGSLTLHFRDGQVPLQAGEMYVVPRGVEHKPVAEPGCKVMLIEPRGVVNTGEAVSELTAAQDQWV